MKIVNRKDNILFLFSIQPLDTASSKMQTCEFGKSKGLWKSLSENTWSESFDGLGISLLLTANPSIQVKWLSTILRHILLKRKKLSDHIIGFSSTQPSTS